MSRGRKFNTIDWDRGESEEMSSEPLIIRLSEDILYGSIEYQILQRMGKKADTNFRIQLHSYAIVKNIHSIVKLCQGYIKIELKLNSNEKKTCLTCCSEVEHEIGEKSVEICYKCGNVSIVPPSKVDDARESDGGRIFHNALDSFCCFKTRVIDLVEMESVLDEYFISQGMMKCSRIRKTRPDRRGQKGYRITVLRQALGACGYAIYYSNVYYIAHKLWDWSMPREIINKKREIIHLYNISQPIVEKHGHMGVQLRLCKLIMLVSNLYDERDFVIPTSEGSRTTQEEYWESSCDDLQPHHPQFVYNKGLTQHDGEVDIVDDAWSNFSI